MQSLIKAISRDLILRPTDSQSNFAGLFDAGLMKVGNQSDQDI